MKRFDPKQQLEKYGWKGGSGLGRDEQGISKAIKAKIKTDTAGVGHNASDEFTFHWWDHVFNKAAKNIKVHDVEGEVSVSKTGHCHVSNKKVNARTLADKNTLYGRFVKGATLLNDGKQVKDSSSDSEVEEEDAGTRSKLSDEAIFKLCGGRTAHKGARHGLGLTGKLQRVAQQDQLFSGATVSHVPHNSDVESGKHKKKKKKEKNRVHVDDNGHKVKATDTDNSQSGSERKQKNKQIVQNGDCRKVKNNIEKKKSKKKNKESLTADIDSDICVKKRQKKSRKQLDIVVDDEEIELNVRKPKRSKKNSYENDLVKSEQEIDKCSPTSSHKRKSFESLQEDELETNIVKKKKKKAKKREVKIID